MKLPKLFFLLIVLFSMSYLNGQNTSISVFKDPLLSKDWVTYYPKKDSINSKYKAYDLVLIPRINSKAQWDGITIADWKPKEFNKSGRFTNWDVLYCGRMKSVPVSGKWRGEYSPIIGMISVFIENTGGNYSGEFKKGQIIRYEIQHINDSLIVGNKLDFGSISSNSIYNHEVDVLPKVELNSNAIIEIVKKAKLDESKQYIAGYTNFAGSMSSAYPRPSGYKSNEFIDFSVLISKNGTIKVNHIHPSVDFNDQLILTKILKNAKITPAKRNHKNVSMRGTIRIMKKMP